MTKMRLIVFPVQTLFALVLTACGFAPSSGCTTEARPSVSVKVVDAQGAPVPDATLTFSNGALVQDCVNMMNGLYVCGYEEDGPITVTATKGADTNMQGVTVMQSPDGCHVEGQSITITLGA